MGHSPTTPATALTALGWLDISVPLRTGMVHWPDNPPVAIERMMSIERGDTANVSKLSMGVHTATHMDAPVHFLEHGIAAEQIPLDAIIGPARVISIADETSIKPAELHPHNLQPGERILFKTINSTRYWRSDVFAENFVFISDAAAHYLAERSIRTVGVDYLSVGGYKIDGPQTHHTLLTAGVWIIEGLDLSAIAPGSYELICLPLKIIGSDGAPARAILRPLS